MKRTKPKTQRPIERGDVVLMQGVSCRVVLVCNGEALLSYEEALTAEEKSARKASNQRAIDVRTRYEVCDVAVMVRA